MNTSIEDEIRQPIEAAFEERTRLTDERKASLALLIDSGIAALDRGELRVAHRRESGWEANPWIKKLILLSFLLTESKLARGTPGHPRAYDKLRLKFEDWDDTDFATAGIRVVPGAVVRRGAYVAPDAILMPCFVNIGAYVGSSTMIDTWATVGSCAQIGARCHISGGAGIGGVLEPLGNAPVVIEDGVFVGARAEIAEGVCVRSGAVIGMGVYLGASTPIIDRDSGSVGFGEVPENAVVIAGARTDPRWPRLSTYAAIIVKYANEKTRKRTALNDLVRYGP